MVLLVISCIPHLQLVSVHKLDQFLFSVIPACPESFFKKDSRRASLAGMTNSFNLSRLSFPDLIGESSFFNRFWIVRSSWTMTKSEFINRLLLESVYKLSLSVIPAVLKPESIFVFSGFPLNRLREWRLNCWVYKQTLINAPVTPVLCAQQYQ